MNIITIFLITVQCLVLIVWGWTLGVAVTGIRRDRVLEMPAGESCHKHNFGVLICAHNEENVIGGILDSLKMQTYTADCRKVFLIADRCTDSTCSIASEYDFVTVLRREEEGESRKGIALQWGIEKVLEKERDALDILMVLDADNQVIPEFLELFNERFCQGSLLVTGKRVAMNPYETLISKWYAVYIAVRRYRIFCPAESEWNTRGLSGRSRLL